jgi:hypothetical protein
VEQTFCFNSKNTEQLPLGLGFPNFDCSVDCILLQMSAAESALILVSDFLDIVKN